MNGRAAGLHPAFPDAVVIVDAQGTILQANARAVALFGSPEGKLSGTAIDVLFPDQQLPFSCGGWRRRMPADRYAELTATRGDASRFRAAVAVIPMQTDSGATAVITIRDLTEARETQFILEQSLELLRTVIPDLSGIPRQPGHPGNRSCGWWPCTVQSHREDGGYRGCRCRQGSRRP